MLICASFCGRIGAMKTIEKNEIKKVSKIYTDIFSEYEAYDTLFGKRNRLKRMYYLFVVEVFCAQKFTYKDGDFAAICSIKTPSDREVDMKKLFANPFFDLAFFANVGVKQAKIAKEYVNMADEVAKKYYNPKTDCYIKNIGVKKEFRGQGKLKMMINEICKDMPIFLETQDEADVAIYKKLGFEVCEIVEWRGITHVAMRREGKKN